MIKNRIVLLIIMVSLSLMLLGCANEKQTEPDYVKIAEEFSKEYKIGGEWKIVSDWTPVDDWLNYVSEDIGLVEYKPQKGDIKLENLQSVRDDIRINSFIIVRGEKVVCAFREISNDQTGLPVPFSYTIDDAIKGLESIDLSLETPDPLDPNNMNPDQQAEYNKKMIEEELSEAEMEDGE